jgi:hypothetical protein
MDWELALKVGQGVLVVVQAGVVVVMWAAAKHFATKDELAKATALGNDAHHRLDLLEQRMTQMPTHDDIGVLGERIGSLDQATARLSEQVKGLDRTTASIDGAVERIEQHLLDMKRAA